jgi:hypothetical protein
VIQHSGSKTDLFAIETTLRPWLTAALGGDIAPEM